MRFWNAIVAAFVIKPPPPVNGVTIIGLGHLVDEGMARHQLAGTNDVVLGIVDQIIARSTGGTAKVTDAP